MENFKEFYMEHFGNSCMSFKGRLNRREFVVANLLLLLTTTPLALICLAIMFLTQNMMLTTIAMIISGFISFVLSLSINIRRLHDFNYPSKGILLFFAPLLNILLMIALLCVRGTVGPNDYGEDTLPVDIGEAYVIDQERMSLITKLPIYLKTNIYNHLYTKDLLSFTGRASRREYFVKTVGSFVIYQLVCVVTTFGDILFRANGVEDTDNTLILFVVMAIGFIADIRRGHDRGRSWLHSLWFMVPIINFAYIAKQMLAPGMPTQNEYGKNSANPDEF